jgi:hypothetical protein
MCTFHIFQVWIVLTLVKSSLEIQNWEGQPSFHRHLWSRVQVNSKQTLLGRAAVAIKVQLAFGGCVTVEAGDWR